MHSQDNYPIGQLATEHELANGVRVLHIIATASVFGWQF